jgi:hypothetical protein
MNENSSPKAFRKLRRRIENDLAAAQARFWKAPRSAEQKCYDKPINRQAAGELTQRRLKSKSSN